jgi:hypothetical protein
MRFFSKSMKTRWRAFNTYLSLAALLLAGCATGDQKKNQASDESSPDKQLTALRLHLQGTPTPDQPNKTMQVPILRARPVLVTVERTELMSEHYIASAELVDELEGFSIRLEFDRKGRWILEAVTAQNRGRQIAIFCSFGSERWLAAPLIQQVVTDGKLTFTPDATREEAIRIVRGLNNMAKKLAEDPRF